MSLKTILIIICVISVLRIKSALSIKLWFPGHHLGCLESIVDKYRSTRNLDLAFWPENSEPKCKYEIETKTVNGCRDNKFGEWTQIKKNRKFNIEPIFSSQYSTVVGIWWSWRIHSELPYCSHGHKIAKKLRHWTSKVLPETFFELRECSRFEKMHLQEIHLCRAVLRFPENSYRRKMRKSKWNKEIEWGLFVESENEIDAVAKWFLKISSLFS